MIVIAGTIHIDPSKKKEATDAAIEMMKATHTEPGNIEYAFTWDLIEEGVVRIIEQWEDQAALDAHFDAPHMAVFSGKLGGLGIKGMDVKKFEIASVRPVR